MSAYVDASVLLKRFVEEPDSADADALLQADSELLTARHFAAAQRISASVVGFVTFDLRQAQAARAIGLTVLTS